MPKKKTSGQKPDPASLRARAEEVLRAKPAERPTLPTADVQALVHELNVHQTELEIQNEELRRAQLELADTLDRYFDLYDFAPVGYLTLDKEGRILEANLAAANLLGVERKRLLGSKFSDRIEPDAQDAFYLHRQAVLSDNSRQVCELKLRNADGMPLVARLESIASGPEPKRECHTALIDVTTVHEARRRIEESNQRYHRLTDAVTDYIYRVRVKHGRAVETVHAANCEAVTGYTPDEFHASSLLWIAMVPPEDRGIVERQVAGILSRQDTSPIEHRIQRKDGQIRWVHNTVSPQYDEQGQLVAYNGLVRDITERKEAEEALRQLNETLEQRVTDQIHEVRLLAEAMANLGEGVMITSDHLKWPGPRIVYVNEAMCRITGYPAGELIGQTPRILQGEKTDRETLDRIRQELTDRRPHQCELVNYRKDGTTYDAELFISPLFDSLGTHTNFIAIHRDITERKRTVEALRRQQELSENMIETARIIVLVLDVEGRIVRFNRYLEELTGWPLADVKGKEWIETFLPERDRNPIRKIFARAIAGQRMRSEVHVLVTRDGQELDIEWNDAPLTNARGKLIGLLCTGQDVTERLRAERAVRESREWLQAVLNTAADAIVTIDGKGTIVAVNPATTRLFGYASQELIGENVSVLMPSPYRDEHDGYLKKFRQTGEAKIIGIGREVIAQRKDGSTFSADLAVSEVSATGLYTGIIRDISERKRLEQEVLRISEEEKRNFGHELHDGICQQLGGISFMADSLAKDLSSNDPANAKLATEIAGLLTRAAEDARRISRGLSPVMGEGEGLLDGLEELVKSVGQMYGIQCELVAVDSLPIGNSELATHLYRIAQEAINNAVRHGKAHCISVELTHSGSLLSLCITDDGKGFADNSATVKGMGLRVMNHRAVRLGGQLKVRSLSPGVEVLCLIPWSEGK